MSASSRLLKWFGLGIALILALGLCAFTTYFVSARGLRAVIPAFASNDVVASNFDIAPAGDGLMRLTVHVDKGPNGRKPTGNDLNGYYAEVNGRRYSCEVSAEDPSILVCVGPAFTTGSSVALRLFDIQDRAVFGTTLVVVPMAEAGGSATVAGGSNGQGTGAQVSGQGSGSEAGGQDCGGGLLGSILECGVHVDASVNPDVNANVDANVDAGVNATADINSAQTDSGNAGTNDLLNINLTSDTKTNTSSRCALDLVCLEVDSATSTNP